MYILLFTVVVVAAAVVVVCCCCGYTHICPMEFHNTAKRTDPFLIQGLLGSNLQFCSMRSNSAASDLVLHCLPMSHKKEARLI